MKSGAFIRFAFCPDTAAHHFRQTFAYGQAKACSAVPACRRRIGLAESPEKVLHAFRFNPDASVTNCKMQFEPCVTLLRYLRTGLRIRRFLYPPGIDTDHDFTLFGKFHGIPDEVHKILIHAGMIAEYRGWHARIYQTAQL